MTPVPRGGSRAAGGRRPLCVLLLATSLRLFSVRQVTSLPPPRASQHSQHTPAAALQPWQHPTRPTSQPSRLSRLFIRLHPRRLSPRRLSLPITPRILPQFARRRSTPSARRSHLLPEMPSLVQAILAAVRLPTSVVAVQECSPPADRMAKSWTRRLSVSRALPRRKRGGAADLASHRSTAVLTGAVGGSFGPFPRSSSYYSDGHAPFLQRDSRASSTSLLTLQEGALLFDAPYRLGSPYSASGESISRMSSPAVGAGPQRSTSAARLTGLFGEQDSSLLWSEENKEPDDYLHVRTFLPLSLEDEGS